MAWTVFVVIISLLSLCLWRKVIYHRTKEYSSFPQLPPSEIWGHLPLVINFMRKNTQNYHFDELFQTIHDRLDNPPFYLMDARPLSYPTCIICDHEVAEQLSKNTPLFQYSLPKSPTMVGFFADLMGPTSIALAENERWRGLRKRFSPGFSHMYLTSLLPSILDKVQLFLANLDHYATTREEFSMDSLASQLTFDIIGAVALDTNMDAQLGEKKQSQIFRLFGEFLSTYRVSNGIWALLPSVQKWRLCRRLDMHIKDIITKIFEEQQENPQKQSRSVLSLNLAGRNVLTSELLTETCDQLKTYLFAGHDTTSALLQWAFYEMSRNPRVRGLVRLELDAIFGPESSTSDIRDQILKCGEDVLQKMTYTSAVVKETLRLHPPASTARYAPPNSGLNVRLPNGQEVCLDGVVLYVCHRIIHRDKAVYGDNANEFYPERWLGSSETNIPIPPSAWRPFERGPRNCMGQELANIESLVILACVARRYDWEKVGLGAIKREPTRMVNGQYEVESEVYNTLEISSKPVDGMRMRVKLAA